MREPWTQATLPFTLPILRSSTLRRVPRSTSNSPSTIIPPADKLRTLPRTPSDLPSKVICAIRNRLSRSRFRVSTADMTVDSSCALAPEIDARAFVRLAFWLAGKAEQRVSDCAIARPWRPCFSRRGRSFRGAHAPPVPRRSSSPPDARSSASARSDRRLLRNIHIRLARSGAAPRRSWR